MKEIELTDATGSVSDYAKEAAAAPVILTRKGRPVAAVISLKGVDRETLAMGQNPKCLAILKRGRERRRREVGISTAEMWKRLGLKRRGK